MATGDKAVKKLRELIRTLDSEIPVIITATNVTAKSLVQDRIQETGIDKDGAQMGDYSTRKIPAFFFLGKGTKATDGKLRKLIREKKYISYSDFRKLDGKQNKHVDLTFTGRMWREIGLKQSQTSKNKTVLLIGPKTERSEEIAGYNEERYGNFLELSLDEIETLEGDVKFEVESIIKDYFDDL